METNKKSDSGRQQPQVNPADEVVMLTRRQLATRWQCCEHTIARDQRLQPVRFNSRRLRYRLTDIIALEN